MTTPMALVSADDGDRRVLGWLDAATEQSHDCPMTIIEAREVRGGHRRTRAVDRLVDEIACLCDVRLHAGRILFDGSCTLENNFVRPSPYQRADGRALAPDEQQLVAWQHRLAARISGGAHPGDLRRSQPLEAQLAAVAEAQAATGDRNLESWRDIERAFARLESDANGNHACLLATDLRILENDLAHHERVDLQGRRSKAGRNLLARAREIVTPLRGKMRTCDALERDPQYQRVDARLDVALKRLDRERRLEGATQDQADCNSERDRSELCKAAQAVRDLERQEDQIARKHGMRK
ncbi:MAG: hypothetical protein H0T89_24715 [Deltaproteobacteria bacterium]|nr:hypothetical protein [Deltaproteobacteria bacterium]MDQ3295507.1 hypothetical protein [Myxococcota bacterium]